MRFLIKIIFTKKFPISVICVGNLYVGGTGKTPISIEICKYLKALNQNPVDIAKKYQEQDDEIFLIKKYSKIMVSKSQTVNKAN